MWTGKFPLSCGHARPSKVFPKADLRLWPFASQDLPFSNRPNSGRKSCPVERSLNVDFWR